MPFTIDENDANTAYQEQEYEQQQNEGDYSDPTIHGTEEWRPYLDEDSDSIFWYNHITHVSQWECPFDPQVTALNSPTHTMHDVTVGGGAGGENGTQSSPTRGGVFDVQAHLAEINNGGNSNAHRRLTDRRTSEDTHHEVILVNHDDDLGL